MLVQAEHVCYMQLQPVHVRSSQDEVDRLFGSNANSVVPVEASPGLSAKFVLTLPETLTSMKKKRGGFGPERKPPRFTDDFRGDIAECCHFALLAANTGVSGDTARREFASLMVDKEPAMVEKETYVRDLVAKAIAPSEIFQNLSDAMVDKIVGSMQRFEFNPGDVVMTQGEIGEFMYVQARCVKWLSAAAPGLCPVAQHCCIRSPLCARATAASIALLGHRAAMAYCRHSSPLQRPAPPAPTWMPVFRAAGVWRL